jgi:predicted branched-subunit amino acid permease
MVAGTQLKGLADFGLDFAMVVTFIGIVVPIIRTRPMLACAVVSAVTAVLTYNLPNKAGLMVAAFAGIAAGMIVEAYAPPRENAVENETSITDPERTTGNP